ncbi:hypothetical protein CTZ27_12560 [Streptomyces griseocarneus]|nr:hypothetical protein CTZ27_12560 [Streptomyces griseocarneus]
MADLVDDAARGAGTGWGRSSEPTHVAPGTAAEEIAAAIRRLADTIANAVLAGAEPSRNEPPRKAPTVDETPVQPDAPKPPADLPSATTASSRKLAAPNSSRNEPAWPKRMSQKKAREFIADARVVSSDRETYSYNVVTGDGVVIGHIEPSYKAGRRNGWHGWAAGAGWSSALRVHATRNQAAVDALGQWLRCVTARSRRSADGG